MRNLFVLIGLYGSKRTNDKKEMVGDHAGNEKCVRMKREGLFFALHAMNTRDNNIFGGALPLLLAKSRSRATI